jgi:serine/threonine protein phosphatase PrpC
VIHPCVAQKVEDCTLSLAFEVAAKTDVGCVRVSNEDNFGYDLEHGIFIVCDGMGGHAAGSVSAMLLTCPRKTQPARIGDLTSRR